MIVTISMKDGTTKTMSFRSFLELGQWAEDHYGEYVGIDVKGGDRRDEE